ncbi:MAG: DnaJ domain-containing protein [Pyrinomonadaceae bacterium MAG19_C2-C3]|nr:DnaJ domain-containing protein [Pyrinomonadaceae bacterium MAG19_C2-C3]
MQGTLGEHPLVELLYEIGVRKLSGGLRLRRERVQAAIYAEDGQLVSVAANLRATRFAECVQRWQIFTGAQSSQAAYAIADLSPNASDADYIARLVAARLVDEPRLRELRARQIDETLRLLVAWQDGEWTFDARVRAAAASTVAFDSRSLMLDAARAVASQRAAAHVADDAEIIKPEASARNELLTNLQHAEAFVVSRVEAAMTVGELLAICGLPEASARPAVYTLILGGLLEREHHPRVLSTNTAQVETPKPAASPPSDKSSTGATKLQETDAERKKSLLARGNAVNHYLTLGVSRSVNQAAVKAAYYALAKRFHPDTFPNTTDATERTALEAAFARIAQAYELLKDEQARLAYDRNLDGVSTPTNYATQSSPPASPPKSTVATNAKPPSSASMPETPSNAARSTTSQTSSTYQAEADFQDGLTAIKAGNNVLALTRLSDAARRAPDQARYRAQLGSLLARQRHTRHAAEAELRAAVTLEPMNIDFRIMLAEFYRDMGFMQRATGELERAIAQHPRDARLRQTLADFQKPVKSSATK